MWNIGIGSIELALVLLILLSAVFFRGFARRWLGAILAIAVLSITLSPADPVSAVLVAAPLLVAFAIGVYAAPFFRQANGNAR